MKSISILTRPLFTAAVSLTLLTCGAQASSLVGDYFIIPENHPDANNNIPGLQTGYVQSTLGADGLPVATAFGMTSGHITDVNASNEILWWSTASTHGVTFEKTQTDSLPFSFNSNFFPDGQTDDAHGFRAVHWTGAFNLASPGSITLTLGADDDAFIFVDNMLAVDAGGVKALTSVPTVVTGLSGGNHKIDVFYDDRHVVQAGINLDSSVELRGTPEPGSIMLLGSSLSFVAVGFFRKRRRAIG